MALRVMMMVIGSAAAMSITAAGCGGSQSASASGPAVTGAPVTSPAPVATSTTAVSADYGKQYLAIIDPLNRAIKGMPPSPTVAQLQGLTHEIDHAEGQLLSVHWPATAETDVKSLVSDMGRLAAAVQNEDRSALATAGQSVAAASGIVRSDLGLPSNLSS